MSVLPERVEVSLNFEYSEKPTTTFLIDWESRQIAGMVSELAAMKQAVDIVLQNERFHWQIYSSDFGSELEELVGQEPDYIISELPRKVGEALLADKRIQSVENFTFEDLGSGAMLCRFDVITIFGTLEQEEVKL